MRILRIQIPMMKWTTVTTTAGIMLRNERITRKCIGFHCYIWNGLGFIHIFWMGWTDFQWALVMDPNLSDGYKIHIAFWDWYIAFQNSWVEKINFIFINCIILLWEPTHLLLWLLFISMFIFIPLFIYHLIQYRNS